MYGRDPVTQGRVATPAPAEMQNQLTAALGAGITVENNGVPGSYLRQSLDGTGTYSVPFATRLANDPAQIVIENSAINDWPLRTTAQYAADLTEWINDVRAAGKIPVLEEPNPIYPWTGLDAYVPVMDQVAQQQGVLLIQQYDYIKSLPNWQATIPDGLHPNQALYTIKGDREAAQIKALVQSLR